MYAPMHAGNSKTIKISEILFNLKFCIQTNVFDYLGQHLEEFSWTNMDFYVVSCNLLVVIYSKGPLN